MSSSLPLLPLSSCAPEHLSVFPSPYVIRVTTLVSSKKLLPGPIYSILWFISLCTGHWCFCLALTERALVLALFLNVKSTDDQRSPLCVGRVGLVVVNGWIVVRFHRLLSFVFSSAVFFVTLSFLNTHWNTTEDAQIRMVWKWAVHILWLLFGRKKWQWTLCLYGIKLHFLSPCHCCTRDAGADRSGWKMWSLLPSSSFLLPHHLTKNSWQKEKAAKSRLYLLHCQWFLHSHHQQKREKRDSSESHHLC